MENSYFTKRKHEKEAELRTPFKAQRKVRVNSYFAKRAKEKKAGLDESSLSINESLKTGHFKSGDNEFHWDSENPIHHEFAHHYIASEKDNPGPKAKIEHWTQHAKVLKSRHGFGGSGEAHYDWKGTKISVHRHANGRSFWGTSHGISSTPEETKVAEEVEQLDELSKATLRSYTKKASTDVFKKGHRMGYLRGASDKLPGDHREIAKLNGKFITRTQGISNAVSKLEESEQLDELSKATLGSYTKKSSSEISNHAFQMGVDRKKTFSKGTLSWKAAQRNIQNERERAIIKRRKGLSLSVDKLMKEDTMELQEAYAQGDRVRLHYPEHRRTGEMSTKFHGQTGTIIGHEKDGKKTMHRVSLDHPVHIDGVGHVEDDLWDSSYLKRHKDKSELKEERSSKQSRALAAHLRSTYTKKFLDKETNIKKQGVTVKENFAPISDVITLVANQQHAEATPILNDLLGSRVLDALQSHKQDIARTLFAPGTEALSEESEQLDELSKSTMTSYMKKAVPDLAVHSYLTGSSRERSLKLKNSKPRLSAYSAGVADRSEERSGRRERGLQSAVRRLVKKAQ